MYDFGKTNVYGNFAVSARAPSPVELTCADPEAPCRLPNGFLADPPLDQVVSNTFETGVRGILARSVNWSLGGFLTNVSNDIYFVSAGPARNSGFFTNIGNTRRLGVEASLTKSVGRLQGFLHYTFMNATFEENFTVNSPFHPNADEGEIDVVAGSRIPLLPQHIFKTGLNYSITNQLMVGAEIMSVGSSFIRGDESNELGEDQQLNAYTLLNLRAEYQPLNFLGVFVKANNVLNTEYETFGLLGEADEVAAFEDFEEELFLTPGVPFYFQAGVELSF